MDKLTQQIATVVSDVLAEKMADTTKSGKTIAFSHQVTKGLRYGVYNISKPPNGLLLLSSLYRFTEMVPCIHTIKLYGTPLRDEGLVVLHRMLQSYRQITKLDIGSTELTDTSAQIIANIVELGTITSLNIGSRSPNSIPNTLTHKGLALILDSVSRSTLKSFGMASIASQKQPKEAMFVKLSKSISQVISSAKQLSTLDLSYSNITESDIAGSFSPDLQLRCITLKGNPIKGGTQLISRLSKLKNLASLDISQCQITPEAALLIRECTGLISLNISQNPLGDNVISALLEKLLSVVFLNISSTLLTTAITTQIEKYIQDNRVLYELDISDNHLLGFTVKSESLQRLNASKLKLDDKCSLKLLRSILANQGPSVLNLSNNFITAKCGKTILELIRTSKLIQELDVSSNHIDHAIILGIRDVCKSNKESRMTEKFDQIRKESVSLSIDGSRIPRLQRLLNNITRECEKTKKKTLKLEEKRQNYIQSTDEEIKSLEKELKEIIASNKAAEEWIAKAKEEADDRESLAKKEIEAYRTKSTEDSKATAELDEKIEQYKKLVLEEHQKTEDERSVLIKEIEELEQTYSSLKSEYTKDGEYRNALYSAGQSPLLMLSSDNLLATKPTDDPIISETIPEAPEDVTNTFG